MNLSGERGMGGMFIAAPGELWSFFLNDLHMPFIRFFQ